MKESLSRSGKYASECLGAIPRRGTTALRLKEKDS